MSQMMRRSRRSHEPGHRRKFLVVVDDSPECDRALTYAGRRAHHTDGGVVLLAIIGPFDRQSWMGVEERMRADAQAEAEAALERAVDRLKVIAPDVAPQWLVREGDSAQTIRELIEEDEDIAVLVLAAGTHRHGPGPLVSLLAGKASGTYPIPITIVPGDLSDAEIEALA